MEIYKLDTRLFIRRNIATFLRRPKTIAWLNALLAPWRVLNNEFDNQQNVEKGFAGKINDKLSYSSQTLVLEKLLQVLFTNSNQQVKIENYNNSAKNVKVCFHSESGFVNQFGFQSELDHDTKIGFASEMEDVPFNFKIQIEPASGFNIDYSFPVSQADQDKLKKLRAIVDRYKLSSVEYVVSNY